MAKKATPKPQSNSNGHSPVVIKTISDGQRSVLRSIAGNTVTICSGMAGTGKTHLAVAAGLKKIEEGAMERLVVCRPIVEAGESIGFLPGDISEKTGPYMAPVFDILRSLIPQITIENYQVSRLIEIVPLAYMRGRTFHNAYMILDEAQNATLDQIRMFMSRMGNYSKLVMCGDPTQSDIPDSGFEACVNRLTDMADVGIIHLTAADLARHPIITEILRRLAG